MRLLIHLKRAFFRFNAIGRIVRSAEASGKTLSDLGLDTLKEFHPALKAGPLVRQQPERPVDQLLAEFY